MERKAFIPASPSSEMAFVFRAHREPFETLRLLIQQIRERVLMVHVAGLIVPLVPKADVPGAASVAIYGKRPARPIFRIGNEIG